MGFFSQLRHRLQMFMYGRNGVDYLSRDMSILSMVLIAIGSFRQTFFAYYIGMAVFFLSLFRILSRNRVKRSAENMAYFNLKNKIKNWFATKQQNFNDTKYYRFYKCTSCNQKLRVPKGKGKIEICCPKCGNKFIKKT